MKYKITRRDFLNGVAIGTGTTFLVPTDLFAQVPINGSVDYYPPILTGMRGNHEGSFEVSHALAWQGQKPANYRQLDVSTTPLFPPNKYQNHKTEAEILHPFQCANSSIRDRGVVKRRPAVPPPQRLAW